MKKILKIVSTVIGVSVFGIIALELNLSPATDETTPVTTPAQSLHVLSVSDIKVSDLWVDSNKARAQNNDTPLSLNTSLNQSAQAKCGDMVDRDYWSHNTPDGQTPWTFITIPYTLAAENLAYGFDDAQHVINGWMASPGHRKNLLGDYAQEGFGVCISKNFISMGEQLVIVQHLTR